MHLSDRQMRRLGSYGWDPIKPDAGTAFAAGDVLEVLATTGGLPAGACTTPPNCVFTTAQGTYP